MNTHELIISPEVSEPEFTNQVSNVTNPADWLVEMFGGAQVGGVPVNETTAMQYGPFGKRSTSCRAIWVRSRFT